MDAFRLRMAEKHRESIEASQELVKIANDLMARSLSEPLHKMLRAIARIVVNSNGAVIELVTHGYGNDAMKVARSMFDGAVTIAYLRMHPELLADYFDFESICKWRMFEHFKETSPEEIALVPAERVAEMKTEFERVSPRFKDRTGRRGAANP